MNREQIIQMARESELIMETNCTTPWIEDHDLTPYLERFAKLVAEHEREACAKICEDNWHECGGQCAHVIRYGDQA